MSTLNDNDLFLVERAGTSHSVTSENLMSTIQDDDLMLVERGGVSYKITGADVKDQLSVESFSVSGTPTIDSASATVGENVVGRRTGVVISGGSGNYQWRYAWGYSSNPTTSSSYGTATTSNYTANQIGTLRLRLQVRDTTTNQTLYSGTSSVQVLAAGPDGAVGVITDVNSTGSTLTVSSSANLSSLSFGDSMRMVDSNGNDASYEPITSQIQSVSGTAPSITLNFPNSTDIAYFKPGDVVQSSTVPYNFIWYVDGTNIAISKVGPNYRVKNDIYPTDGPPQTLQEYLNIAPGQFDESLATELWIYGHSGEYSADGFQTSSWAVSLIDTTEYYVSDLAVWLGIGTYPYTSFSAQSSPSPAGTDLKEIRATGYGTGSVEVVSTNASSRQIVVNGGTWNTDSTNDRVIGPAKSGRGTFISSNGTNSVNLNGSNNEWIDDKNRLGNKYYAVSQNYLARRAAVLTSFYESIEGAELTPAEIKELFEYTIAQAVEVFEPFDLNGFYPLYYTEEKAIEASPSDTYHSHEIDGTTYYMPNGVTFYHGNYGTNSY